MGATHIEGPLDISRSVVLEAEELNQRILERPGEGDGLYLEALLRHLDSKYPLYGKEVIAYGEQLTVSIDETGEMKPFATVPRNLEDKIGPMQGIHDGFVMRTVYDTETGMYFRSIFHSMVTSYDAFYDEFNDQWARRKIDHVFVKGSEIVPADPQNAHSMQELQGDKFIEEIDACMSSQVLSPLGRLHAVVAIANQMLREHDADVGGDREFQRISYINSLGLLDGLVVVTNDLVIAQKRGSRFVIDEGSEFSEMSDKHPLKPSMFYPSPSYLRAPNRTIEFDCPPEVFAVARAESGKMAMASTERALKIIRA